MPTIAGHGAQRAVHNPAAEAHATSTRRSDDQKPCSGRNLDRESPPIIHGAPEVLDDEDYRQQRAQVLAEQEGAQAALQRAQDHVAQTERTGVVGDAEQALLHQLQTVKDAVADGVGRAPNLNALRNVIGTLFESIELVRGPGFGKGVGDGFRPPVENALVNDREHTYALLPKLRWSAVDLASESSPWTGIRQAELPPSTDHDSFVYGSRNSKLYYGAWQLLRHVAVHLGVSA